MASGNFRSLGRRVERYAYSEMVSIYQLFMRDRMT